MFNAERFYREKSARQLCEALRQHVVLFRSNFLPSRLYARGHEPIANVDGTDFDRKESQRLLKLVDSIRREFPDIFDEYSSVLRRAELAWRAMQLEN
jgi:hypothetical protein